MDERTDWQRPGETRDAPPRFEGWRESGGEYAGARPGGPGAPRVPDLSALLAIVDALRRAVPHELQETCEAQVSQQSPPRLWKWPLIFSHHDWPPPSQQVTGWQESQPGLIQPNAAGRSAS